MMASPTPFQESFESLTAEARRYMCDYGYHYNGDFTQTPPGGKPEKFGEPVSKSKKCWLKCDYRVNEFGTLCLTITFGRHEGSGQKPITKTFPDDKTSSIQLSNEERERLRQQNEALKHELTEEAKRKKAESIDKALDCFGKASETAKRSGRFTPPKGAETYFSKKSFDAPYDVRGFIWELRGRQWIGLAVFHDVHGKFSGIQELYPSKITWGAEGKPRNKNFIGSYAGAFHTLDKLEDGKTLYVCEGVATMRSVSLAMGQPTIAVGSSTNLRNVIVKLRSRYPHSRLILCGELDKAGHETALKVAMEFGLEVVFPVFPEEERLDADGNPRKDRSDLDDMRQLLGLDAVKGQLRMAEFVTKKEKMPQLNKSIRHRHKTTRGTSMSIVAEEQKNNKIYHPPTEEPTAKNRIPINLATDSNLAPIDYEHDEIFSWNDPRLVPDPTAALTTHSDEQCQPTYNPTVLLSQKLESRSIEQALVTPLEIDAQDNMGMILVDEALEKNETGDAKLFAQDHKEKFLWHHESGWYQCDLSGYWNEDVHKTRYGAFEGIADMYRKAGEREADQKEAKRYNARATALRTTKRRSAVLETASSMLALQTEWNRAVNELPCKNGIVDLRTGILRPVKPNDYLCTFSPTTYNPDAKCLRFKQFLEEIMLGRCDVISFLQRLFGYILLGDPKEEIVVIFYGPEGRNGKGTLVQTLENLLGPIARTFKSEMLLEQRMSQPSGNASPDLARLDGCRFAIFSEINRNRQIDASKVKNLSGRDTISARKLYSNDDLGIKPTHTMILQTNHLPRAPADDTALWARMYVVPFDVRFTKNPTKDNHKPIDESLKGVLAEEASGILLWLVEGAKAYCKNGLGRTPNAVLKATEQYRQDSDPVAKFLEEYCEFAPEFMTSKAVAIREIQDYARANKMSVPNRLQVIRQLNDQWEEARQGTTRTWKGFRMRDEDAD